MSRLITRRKVMTTALTALGGASGLAVAARLADRYGLIPPDHSGLYGAGETLTYASHRLLTAHGSLAREFRPDQISKVAPINGPPPTAFDYQNCFVADSRIGGSTSTASLHGLRRSHSQTCMGFP